MGLVSQNVDEKLLLHFHSTFLKISLLLVLIYVKAKSVQGCLLLPEVLYLSRVSWGHFCGPAREGGEGDNGTILVHKFPVSHPILNSAIFLIILVCADLS